MMYIDWLTYGIPTTSTQVMQWYSAFMLIALAAIRIFMKRPK